MKNILTKIIYLLIFLCSSEAYLQNPKWEIVGNMPYGVSGAEVIATDSLIYFLGGFSDSLQNITNKIIAYNPEKKVWYTNLGQLIRKRRNFVAGKYLNLIISVGGERLSPSSYAPIEFFQLPNLNNGILDSSKYFERNRSTGLIYNNILYVIGGLTQQPAIYNDYIIEYNLSQKKITYLYDSLFSGLKGVIDQMSCFLDNNIYIFGGLFNTVMNHIYKFNIFNHSLIRLKDIMLSPRANGRAVRLGETNTILLIGGYNEKNAALNTVESYQFLSNDLIVKKVMPSLNFKRRDFMAVYYKNKVYVFGGVNEYNDAVLPIEAFPVSTNIDNETEQKPDNFNLYQNYPNPFNPVTNIVFSIKFKANVSLIIYNSFGQKIDVLIDEVKEAGNYKIEYNAKGLASGIYFYRLIVKDIYSNEQVYISETRKMILMK